MDFNSEHQREKHENVTFTGPNRMLEGLNNERHR